MLESEKLQIKNYFRNRIDLANPPPQKRETKQIHIKINENQIQHIDRVNQSTSYNIMISTFLLKYQFYSCQSVCSCVLLCVCFFFMGGGGVANTLIVRGDGVLLAAEAV